MQWLKKRWKLIFGGNCRIKPRIGQLLAKNLSDDVLDIVGKIITYYKKYGEKKCLGWFIEEISFEKFKEDVLL